MFAFLLIAGAYYLTGKLGLTMAIPPGVATSVWPASGIASAGLLMGGLRFWPAVFLGSWFLNTETLFLSPNGNSLLFSAATASLFATGSTLQACVGAKLISRHLGKNPFVTASSVMQFALIQTAVCTIAASVGVLGTFVSGLATQGDLFHNWRTWWLGDLVGVILFAPPILLYLSRDGFSNWPVARKTEIFAIWIALLLCCEFVFGRKWGLGEQRYPIDFLLGLPLLWAGMRLRPFGVSLCILVVSSFVVYGTHAGLGPFVRENISESLFFAQAFVGVGAIAVLAMSALLIERQGAEAAAKRSMGTLAEVNRELQTFTYGVSHDLKEPVRTISTQLQLLEWKYKQALETDARQLIDYTVDAAKRMTGLIDDLLVYGQTEGTPFKRDWVEVSEIIRRVKSDLKTAIDSSGAEISWDPMPVVFGDETHLTRLVQNLLVNAIKFRGEASPRIHIGARQEATSWILSVQDCGVGFDMKKSEKLFEPFVRLHGRDQYPGSGLGLSLCRKIVERHGGRIWAESAPGKGAIFFFSLPAQA